MNGPSPRVRPLTVAVCVLVVATAGRSYAGGGLAFANAQRKLNGDPPLTVALADFDHDGLLDLLFVSGVDPTQKLRAVRGTGSGGFAADTVSFENAGPEATALMTVDFDGDGLLDAVVADPAAKRIRVWMDDGDSTWPPFLPGSQPDVYSLSIQPNAIGTADFDGDGDPDLVYAGLGQFWTLLNDGDGFLQVSGPSFGGTATALVVGDLGGDGLADVIVATTGRIRAFESLGGGAFAPFVLVHDEGVATNDGLALTDIDQDGVLDIVAALPGGLAWFRGDGQGAFAGPSPIGSGPAQRLLVDDLSSDGLADVVLMDGESVRTMLAHGDGSFTEQAGATLVTPLTDVAAGDVNGDGRRDVVVTHGGGVAVLENLGGGQFPDAVDFPVVVVTGWSPPAFCDLDGDGDLDVVCAVGTSPRIHVNPGTGGSWPAHVDLPAAPGEFMTAVVVGDLDGELGPDIASPAADGLALWLNTGPLTYAAPILVTGPQGEDPNLSDVDLDGDLDLLNNTDDGVTVFLNDGHAAFTATSITPIGGGIAVDDFDRDGVPDLAIGDGAVDVYQGQGDGTFVFRSTAAAAGDRLHTGDVDGDGLPDLIQRSSDDVVVVTNQGDFGFGPAVTWSAGEAGVISVAQCADLDDEAGGELILGCPQQLLVMKATDGAFVPHSGYALPAGPPVGSASFELADMDADGDLDAAVAVGLSVNVFQLVVLPGRAADPWKGLSGGLAGVGGLPELSGSGSLQPSTPVSLHVSRAAPAASVVLVVGLKAEDLPFKGGTLVPQPRLVVPGLNTSALGTVTLSATWPAALPAGLGIVLQAWIPDAAAPAGLSATNALMAVQP